MEYHEAVDSLHGLRRRRPEMGTETTASLLADLGAPHEGVTAVQIAGSNGKGSTASVLDRILREAGLTVGLYTSPDLNDLRERIRVDGAKMPKREVCSFVDQAWPHVVSRSVEGGEPTFFEAITAMALWHFGREDVDVAVLEVGIGGRYDATSVVSPVAAAITSVSLEHTDVLGSTVEEIARDKAQVAPDDAPLVTAATGRALETIREETAVITVGEARDADRDAGDAEHDAGDGSTRPGRRDEPDVCARETGMVSSTESSVSLIGPEWEVTTETPLLGRHQAINAGIAATVARQVAAPSEREIAAGIRNVCWPGRFEVMDDTPLTVLDGAHNPAACETVTTLLERFEYEDLVLVFGAMRDKDHAGMRRALPDADDIFLAAPSIDRAQGTDALEQVFEGEPSATVTSCPSVPAAVRQACRAAGAGDCVLVTGSLYLVAEARPMWTRTPTPVRTDTRRRAQIAMKAADVPSPERKRCGDRLVTRTVRIRTRPAVATELTELLGAAGGTVVRSGLSETRKPVSVVLSGTLQQFTTLIETLRGRSGEARALVDRLNEALRIGSDGRHDEQPWAEGTAVMGILNVTPDSFSDGGEHDSVGAAVDHATDMVAAGADIVDVGGESTRPGAEPVPAATERDRVLPVIDRLDDLDALVSIDTRKPSVAAAALDAGADVVNDVSGLGDAAMRRLVADRGVPVVCMHSLDVPVDPDRRRAYDDVVSDVLDELAERVLLAERAGIDRSRIIVDPGLGFGKRASESFELLDRLDEFRALGTPIMVGHSRKSMFDGAVQEPEGRLAATVAATALAAERGVDVVRVHDVRPNVAAVSTAEATTSARDP